MKATNVGGGLGTATTCFGIMKFGLSCTGVTVIVVGIAPPDAAVVVVVVGGGVVFVGAVGVVLLGVGGGGASGGAGGGGVLEPPPPDGADWGFALLGAVLSGDVGAVTCGGGALNLAIKVSRTTAAACGDRAGAAVDASWLLAVIV